ncbi:MAG: hypothetical protein IIA40_09905 [SAR324 cluster bacterium]|nr:hypothetical protein [SAR324 cluster bacterium]
MRYYHWFLIIAVVLVGYVLLSGREQRYTQPARRLDYSTRAVSRGLTAEALALDLENDLDVSLLPEIGKQAIRQAAQQGLKEQAFLEAVLRDVSDRVREISTIDINQDGQVDPILVKPEPAGKEQYVLLSLQVPAVESYPLPSASDAAAWKKVETFEVATMSVSFNEKELAVEASGNQHVYPNTHSQRYYAHDRNPSFLQTYMTIRMMEWMFFPRYYGFYGPGYGYGFYRPMGVPMVMSRRTGAIRSRGYQRAASSTRPVVRGRSGAAPRSAYQSKYSGQPPRSLSQLRSSRSFARRQTGGTVRSGGFGRGTGARQAAPTRRYSSQRTRSRGFGGFGRGFSRSAFGGGGRRFGK